MSTTLSIERMAYHAKLERFRGMLDLRCTVLDIGKSDIHDYRSWFDGYRYLSIDPDAKKAPDINAHVRSGGVSGLSCGAADAVLCNGVTEQCTDPFELCIGVYSLLRAGGLALFGIASVGFPIYANDKTRFTPLGARELLINSYFSIVDEEVIIRPEHNLPSYVLLICRKGFHV